MTDTTAPEPEPEQFYTVGKVAELFAVTPTTVRNWIKTNQIKGVKIGKEWRVSRSEVHRFANSTYGDG